MKPSGMFLTLSALTLSLSGGLTYAQEGTAEEGTGEDAAVFEVTMRLLPPNAQASDQALRELTLPTRPVLDEDGNPVFDDDGNPVEEFIPSEQGQLHGGEGLLRANEARFEGVANGAAAAEAAQNNREEHGRGTMPTLPPQAPNDMPGQPEELPGPPDNPGRP